MTSLQMGLCVGLDGWVGVCVGVAGVVLVDVRVCID